MPMTSKLYSNEFKRSIYMEADELDLSSLSCHWWNDSSATDFYNTNNNNIIIIIMIVPVP